MQFSLGGMKAVRRPPSYTFSVPLAGAGALRREFAGLGRFWSYRPIGTEPLRGASLDLPARRERSAIVSMAFSKDEPPRSPGGTQSSWSSPLLRAVLLAQVLSLLLCVMGTTSGLLASRGINMPATQSFFNYLLLSITCGAYHLRNRGLRLSNPWYCYLLLAVMDVEANFLVTKAYQYTSVTSVTLLDCFTIPAVMALSALALRARYLPGHYTGAALCIGGLALLVATDGASATGGSQPLLGDALVLMGSLLYACSNVAQERLLLGATPVSELLAAVGSFAALVGGMQAVLLERGAWLAADWTDPWAVAAPLAGFSLALYTFALLLPLVLMWSGATVLNLSLLTSDVWAAGARVAFFGGFGGTAGWFALSLLFEAVGLVLYTRAGQTHPHPVGGGEGRGGGCDPRVGDDGGFGAEEPYYLRISSFGVEGHPDLEDGRRGGGKPATAAPDGLGGSGGGAAAVALSMVSSATAAAAAAVVSGLGRGDAAASRPVGGSAVRGYGVLGTEEERVRLVGLEAEFGSTEEEVGGSSGGEGEGGGEGGEGGKGVAAASGARGGGPGAAGPP
ncbi:hypothetical protein PLESTB_000765200 [Pleodorina starrii]|uniref:Solute carrier family 35 member F2 n=1 Tax=Pleodorina starrii TaxID=330485 RepID=A0A9W6F2U0_9CHLO|nr:hypothetical protein PLESTM_000440100 [Pleodorina starrii]GLC53581.1 hypothetical protein PLESTB_000765200 [Pleodorina starrii]